MCDVILYVVLSFARVVVTIRSPDVAAASGEVKARVDPPLLRFRVVCLFMYPVMALNAIDEQRLMAGPREASAPPCTPPFLCEQRVVSVPAGACLDLGVICGVEAPSILRRRYDLVLLKSFRSDNIARLRLLRVFFQCWPCWQLNDCCTININIIPVCCCLSFAFSDIERTRYVRTN